MVAVADANTLCDTRVDLLGPPRVLISPAVKEENVGSARGHDSSPFPSASVDIPQADRPIVQGGDGQEAAKAIVSVVWVVEGHASDLDEVLQTANSDTRRLQPVDTCWALALNVLVIPRDVLTGECWVPVGHVLEELEMHLGWPRGFICVWE